MPNQKLKYHEGQQLFSAHVSIVSNLQSNCTSNVDWSVRTKWFRCIICHTCQFHNGTSTTPAAAPEPSGGFQRPLAHRILKELRVGLLFNTQELRSSFLSIICWLWLAAGLPGGFAGQIYATRFCRCNNNLKAAPGSVTPQHFCNGWLATTRSSNPTALSLNAISSVRILLEFQSVFTSCINGYVHDRRYPPRSNTTSRK